MATRLYIDRNGYSPTPADVPVVNGAWGSDLHGVYCTAPAGHGSLTTSTSLLRTVATSSSAGSICHAIMWSPPIAVNVNWATAAAGSPVDFKVCYRISEASTTMDVFPRFVVGLASNDGTVIETSAVETDGTEASTSLISRRNISVGGKLSSSTVPGDRFFWEIGWNKTASVAGDVTIAYMYSTTAGDLSDADGDSGIENPWLEMDCDITFDPEGTSYGGRSNNLMLMGVT